MSTPLELGVIGLGRMGYLYARALASGVSGARLYAVADGGEEERARVTAEFDIPHAFADALAALEIGLAATRAYQTGGPITLSELWLSSI